MRSTKQHKLDILRGWLNDFLDQSAGHSLKDKDFDALTRSLTIEQLQFINLMVATAGVVASDKSREYWARRYHTMREAAQRATGDKTLTFKRPELVVSNA